MMNAFQLYLSCGYSVSSRGIFASIVVASLGVIGGSVHAQTPVLTVTSSDVTTSSSLSFQNGFNLTSLRAGNPYVPTTPPGVNTAPAFEFQKYFGLLGNDNFLEYDSFLSGRFASPDGYTPDLHVHIANTEYSNSSSSATPFTLIQSDPGTFNDFTSETVINFSISRAANFTHGDVVFADASFDGAQGTAGSAYVHCTYSLTDSSGTVLDSYTVTDTDLANPGGVLGGPSTSNTVVLAPGNYVIRYGVDSYSEVYGVFSPGNSARAEALGGITRNNGLTNTATAISLTGDYDGNGTVSQGDLDLVLLNWGDTTRPAGWLADEQFPTSGGIGQAQLDGVLLNWGDTVY